MSTAAAQKTPTRFGIQDLEEIWSFLSPFERLEGLRALPKNEANDFFRSLNARDQADLILSLPLDRRQAWLQVLAPDDLADMIQEVSAETRGVILSQLDDLTRKEVNALLAYAEDVAGGLMNPRYIRLRPDMTVEEAFSYLRKQAQEREHFYDAYVLDNDQHLLGVVRFKELFSAPYNSVIRDVMRTDLEKAQEDLDQESLSRLFKQHNLVAIPVVDADNKMKGIVTIDDIVDVVQEEATADIQKMGGSETLDAPYVEIGFWRMVKKRGGWLAALFLGEMLTATAMGYFQVEIERAAIVALFVPLIISSGGNSGSQATSIIIRSLALRELKLGSWPLVMWRELSSGLSLGMFLGAIGFIRIILWYWLGWQSYNGHPVLIGITVWASLVGVVAFGSVIGSMLPFILRRLGFDPASASAPFVATLVDVTGLVIYFSVAQVILRGVLL
jgi:magnesium transporter